MFRISVIACLRKIIRTRVIKSRSFAHKYTWKTYRENEKHEGKGEREFWKKNRSKHFDNNNNNNNSSSNNNSDILNNAGILKKRKACFFSPPRVNIFAYEFLVDTWWKPVVMKKLRANCVDGFSPEITEIPDAAGVHRARLIEFSALTTFPVCQEHGISKSADVGTRPPLYLAANNYRNWFPWHVNESKKMDIYFEGCSLFYHVRGTWLIKCQVAIHSGTLRLIFAAKQAGEREKIAITTKAFGEFRSIPIGTGWSNTCLRPDEDELLGNFKDGNSFSVP